MILLIGVPCINAKRMASAVPRFHRFLNGNPVVDVECFPMSFWQKNSPDDQDCCRCSWLPTRTK